METILIRLGRQQAFPIGELSEIAVARRAAVLLGQRLGFDEVRTGELAIIVTEAATNIAKHAQHGEILLRSVQYGEATGVEVLAIDSGPGINNISLQMQDGNSTVGTYGVGLGAIVRLSHEFDIYSLQDRGSILLMVIWATLAPLANLDWCSGVICIPIAGEDICGDDWSIEYSDGSVTLLVADGLGHGPDAAKASNAAVAAIENNWRESPALLLQRTHKALHGTRGAAVAITQIDEQKQQLRFAGVGNIAVTVFDENNYRHLLSHNGIVGSNLRKVQEFSYPWLPHGLLIAHSDGIGTRWSFDHYPGLIHAHPSLIAAVLYRDFTRGRDDVTVVVLRHMADQ